MKITEFALLDTETALERLDNDKQLYAELIKSFLDTTSFNAETLYTLISDSCCDNPNILNPAAQYVHRIKGAAANIGADRLAAAAGQLEQILRGKTQGDIPELSALTQTCYNQTADALTKLVL